MSVDYQVLNCYNLESPVFLLWMWGPLSASLRCSSGNMRGKLEGARETKIKESGRGEMCMGIIVVMHDLGGPLGQE